MLRIEIDGIPIACQRRGCGTPLVLIHGYPLDHSIWNPVAAILEPVFDLILPDLRGFGQSGGGHSRYQLGDLANDLAALLDHLEIKETAIAGHSMGGYVALAFASQYPQRVTSLGLVASQANADPPEKKTDRLQLAERVETNGVGEVANSMPALLTADLELQLHLKQIILRQKPQGVASALRAMASRPDSTDTLTGFDRPVVIIHGQEDRLIPVDRARDGRKLVKTGSLVEIEAAGHMPMMEATLVTAQALHDLH
jgi:3-oxoadipate enol-lactonase